eukprot:4329580-Amphidinium_carterae.1
MDGLALVQKYGVTTWDGLEQIPQTVVMGLCGFLQWFCPCNQIQSVEGLMRAFSLQHYYARLLSIWRVASGGCSYEGVRLYDQKDKPIVRRTSSTEPPLQRDIPHIDTTTLN